MLVSPYAVIDHFLFSENHQLSWWGPVEKNEKHKKGRRILAWITQPLYLLPVRFLFLICPARYSTIKKACLKTRLSIPWNRKFW